MSIQVETFGTGRVDDGKIAARVESAFDFPPAAIVRDLGLRRTSSRQRDGFFRKLATFGHMGRQDFDVPWERTDRVDALA